MALARLRTAMVSIFGRSCGRLGIAEHHCGQVIFFRADKRVKGDEWILELGDIRLQLDPEAGVFGFLAQLCGRHVVQFQLTQLKFAAGNDKPCILCEKADLIAKASNGISDPVLLTCQLLQIKLGRQ